MKVQLKSKQLKKFIADQVKAGYFPSAQAAIEAAVAQMMVDRLNLTLTDEDIEAIDKSDAQIGRGDCIDFDTFAAEMRKKYGKE